MSAAAVTNVPALVGNVVPATAANSSLLTPAGKQRPRYTVDPASLIINTIEHRIFDRDFHDSVVPQPNSSYQRDLMLPLVDPTNISHAYCTRLVHTSINNKFRCAVNAVVFTPDKQRVITGSQAGQFSCWFSSSFNFDTSLQSHNASIRCMKWNKAGEWMLSGDESGHVKYWQSNLRPQEEFPAHEEAIRSLDFSPNDSKFVTASDDKVLRVWDFWTHKKETELMGHNWNINAVSWHPSKSLIASASKDSTVRLWDAKAGKEVRTITGHKNWVTTVAWNSNGHWLASGGRDTAVRLWDIRMMREFSSISSPTHKGITAFKWHPHVESLFVVGHLDGATEFFHSDISYPQATIPHAHDSAVFDFAWAPSGGLLVSVSNDHTTKFWARSRPGDTADQYAYQGNALKLYPAGNNSNLVPMPGRETSAAAVAAALAAAAAAGVSFEEIEAQAKLQVRTDERVVALAGGEFSKAREAASGAAPAAAGAPTAPGAPAPTPSIAELSAAAAAKVISQLKPPPVTYICNACQKPGHWIQECEVVKKRKEETEIVKAGGDASAIAALLPKTPGPGYLCRKCNLPGHWIQDCPNASIPGVRPPPGPSYICNKCKQPGHWIDECPNVQPGVRPPPGPSYICNKCKQPGHWIDECPNVQPGVRPPPGPSYVCKRCNQPGHWIEECPNDPNAGLVKGQGPPPVTYICHGCGKPGHWKNDCPKLKELNAGGSSMPGYGGQQMGYIPPTVPMQGAPPGYMPESMYAPPPSSYGPPPSYPMPPGYLPQGYPSHMPPPQMQAPPVGMAPGYGQQVPVGLAPGYGQQVPVGMAGGYPQQYPPQMQGYPPSQQQQQQQQQSQLSGNKRGRY
jgi:polyadenylation factor subunit 2